MTDKLKELIENAPIKRSGVFTFFMLVPTGEKYDGFWGENGYNKCLLLGQCDGDDTWYKITDYADAISFGLMHSVSFDIPTEYNTVRFWFNEPIRMNNDLNLSQIQGYGKELISK